MNRSNYRRSIAPKDKSRARTWHRKPAVKAKATAAAPRSNFPNISTEQKHGRGPRK